MDRDKKYVILDFICFSNDIKVFYIKNYKEYFVTSEVLLGFLIKKLFIAFSNSKVGMDIEESSTLKFQLDYLINVLPRIVRKDKKFVNKCIEYYFERCCQIEDLYKLPKTGLVSFLDQFLSDLKYKTYYKINNKSYIFIIHIFI